MHDANDQHPGRHIPFKREGWGAAAFVCGLAVVTALAAGYVHKRTYKHPTDTRFQAAGSATKAAAH
jgi:hypothetical protein